MDSATQSTGPRVVGGETEMTKTTNVRAFGTTTKAYAERNGDSIVVRVYDSVAGHYTVCHSLTQAQLKYVISRTLSKAD
jgi:hypothetical protein